jgi:hypothetical protein
MFHEREDARSTSSSPRDGIARDDFNEAYAFASLALGRMKANGRLGCHGKRNGVHAGRSEGDCRWATTTVESTKTIRPIVIGQWVPRSVPFHSAKTAAAATNPCSRSLCVS